ncbi:MAG: sulfatase-like hydrolase/transferase [Bacteroidales bacterium]|nr:sulfatase-like hydrolase/transferase [Bacteroidales bacterium]
MNRKKGINIYAYVILKWLLACGALAVVQVVFYLFNTRIFHVDGFGEWMGILWGNVVFGLATVATFLGPWFVMMLLPLKVRWKRWYRIVAEVLYIAGVLLILVPRGANMAYYQYTYRLLSDEIFSYLGISGQMGSLAPHFAVDYWYAWVMPLIIGVLFLIANSRLHFGERNKYNKHLANDLFAVGVGLVALVIMGRGGVLHMLQPEDAGRWCQPKNSALVSNDAYNIVRTLFKPDLEEKEYMPAADAATLFTYGQQPMVADSTAATDSAIVDTIQPRNVVLIVLESFGQEFMGCYNRQEGADTRTPFLDSLAQHSLVYDGRSNGKKSIEGIMAINTGIPNLMSIPMTNSVYGNDDFTGLPAVLRKNGYRTAFFHGSYNGVMEFDRTCEKIGFDEYHGMNEYNADEMARKEDYDGVWGIFDEPFLQYTAKHIGTYSEPFFAEVFTVTSHHPFPIPDEHKGQFKEGRHPILKCVEYTDYSLRRFFEAAKQQPWYGNTLFVICGDHSGHGLTPEYNDYDGWYRIPMMVFDPQHDSGIRSSRIVQQTDLFPTLVDMLGFGDEETLPGFGESAVRQPALGRQVYYGNGYHVMVSNNSETPSHHDITILMGQRAIGEYDDIKYLKALIQQYNYRVINNKL